MQRTWYEPTSMLAARGRVEGTTIVALAMALAACRRDGASSAPSDAEPSPSAANSASSFVVSERCTLLGAPLRLGADAATSGLAAANDDAPVPFGAEIGGAVADARGFVFGLHEQGLAGDNRVRWISFEGARTAGEVTIVATLPRAVNASIARAPILSLATKRGVGAPIAAADLEVVEGVRHLRVHRLEAKGQRLIGDVRQDDDESEVSAIAEAPSGAVASAWDEGDATHRRGEIHLRAQIGVGGVAAAAPSASTSSTASPRPFSSASTKGIATPIEASPEVVSPIESDAEAPTLVPIGDGARAILFWLSERPDTAGDAERAIDAGAGEPSQEEANRWLEARLVDLRTGSAIGPTRALTGDKGHVQTFSAALSIAGDAIFVALRDDARPTDGDGGSIHALAIPLSADGVIGEPARTMVADTDVAPGMPRLVLRASGAFVAYLDADDRGWLAPVFGGGVSRAAPETALAKRSVIASAQDRVLTARVVGAAVEIAVVRCHE